MAEAISKNTDIENQIKKIKVKENTFGVTSNKFGRIVLTNLIRYDNMVLNNDTLRDENGLNEKFIRFSEAEYKVIIKAVKNKKEADIEKSNKLMAEKVSQLGNFITKYKNDEIPDEKTGLVSEILEQLDLEKTAVVDNSKALQEKDDIIAKLKAELQEVKKEEDKPKATSTPKKGNKKDKQEEAVETEVKTTDADEESPF